MPTTTERVDIRSAFPVDGTGLYVREPLAGELKKSLAMTEDNQFGLLFAYCFVDEFGKRIIADIEGETPIDLAKRGTDEADQLRATVYVKVRQAISKLLEPADPKELAKN